MNLVGVKFFSVDLQSTKRREGGTETKPVYAEFMVDSVWVRGFTGSVGYGAYRHRPPGGCSGNGLRSGHRKRDSASAYTPTRGRPGQARRSEFATGCF